jgi:acetyltransferase-like isoleucine patch superfamily enzyme
LSGEPFRISTFPIDELEPAVAFNGSDYLVVWRDRFGVKARVVPTDGVLDSVTLVVSTENHQKLEPAVASDGSRFLVVWRDSRNLEVDFSDINGQFVQILAGNPTLIGSNFLVGPVVGHQIAPSIAFGAGVPGTEGYLVTWTEAPEINSPESEFDAFGAVFDRFGTNVTGPISIATGDGPQGSRTPAETAFDGSNYLVVFQNDGRLHGKRVSATGLVHDTAGIVIAETCARATTIPCTNDVAFGDGEYLVTWDDGARIRGARVTPAGDVLDPTAINLSRTNVDQQLPAVAFGGGDYLVAWEVTGTNDKYAQLVGPTTPVIIDDTATVADDAVIGDGSTVGANTVIAKGVTVGEDSSIGANVTVNKETQLGDNTVVGDDSTIHKNVTAGNDLTVGDNVTIHKDVVIGTGVTIGDNTEIHSGTEIGDDVWIGSGVFIGNNVTIPSGQIIENGEAIPNNTTVP